MSLLELRPPHWLGLAVLLSSAACGDEGRSESIADADVGSEDAAVDSAADASVEASADASPDAELGYAWNLPSNLPEVVVPADNPMTEEKVQLGRHLFYDKRLSGNGTQSCATCHEQKHAFADTRAVGLGSTGESHRRGSMSLANVAYAPTLTWADPNMLTLEQQALTPMFGKNPIELGGGTEEELIAKLRTVDKYQTLFAEAFPDEAEPFSVRNVTRALASFQRSLISGNSRYDRYNRGDKSAMSESALHGKALFESETFDCFHCHGGELFTDQFSHAGKTTTEKPFHNTGLYNLDRNFSYPAGNQGLIEHTRQAQDMGKFKAPTLRNIAVTAPYMHDGSITTLEGVLDHYKAGGRTIVVDGVTSIGFDSFLKDPLVHGFGEATPQDIADLIEFLKSLTDDEFLTNPKHSDPWL